MKSVMGAITYLSHIAMHFTTPTVKAIFFIP
jgi:hypothetical protein